MSEIFKIYDIFNSFKTHLVRGGFSAEYQAVYDAMTTPPSESVAANQNTFVQTLVTNGQWAKIDMLKMFAQESNGANEALLDWITPASYIGSLVNAPTFTSLEGFKGNGSNQEIDLNWNPTTNGVKYIQDSASYGVYIRQTTALLNDVPLGVLDAVRAYPAYNGTAWTTTINGTASRTTSALPALGMLIVNRSSTLDVQTYLNKVKVIDFNNSVSTGLPNKNFFGLSRNASAQTDMQISMIFAGGSLNQADVNAITDAFEVYMDSNSKGVIP